MSRTVYLKLGESVSTIHNPVIADLIRGPLGTQIRITHAGGEILTGPMPPTEAETLANRLNEPRLTP